MLLKQEQGYNKQYLFQRFIFAGEIYLNMNK